MAGVSQALEDVGPDRVDAVEAWLRGLQDRICTALERADGAARFREDAWTRAEGGGGRTRVLRDGAVFEQAGVGYSRVEGARMPPSATAQRPELEGKAWVAAGVSVVIHPRNPYVPTTHLNVRLFVARGANLTTTPHPRTDSRQPATPGPPGPGSSPRSARSPRDPPHCGPHDRETLAPRSHRRCRLK